MPDFVKTRQMEEGPLRVPVMVEKDLAQKLASYVKEHGTKRYDHTLDQVIRLGLEAAKRGPR